MPTVIINDVPLEAKMGERLLNIARRNAAHIGFACDGNGICQTCQCRVLDGAQFLSPPSQAERDWLPETRLAKGYRLACQAGLRGRGPVSILTTVEELRRQTLDVVRPPAGQSGLDNLGPLLENWTQLNIDQIALFPSNVLRTLTRVGPLKLLFPVENLTKWLEDGGEIARKVAAQTVDRPATQPGGDSYERRLLAMAEALKREREKRDRVTG